MRLNFKSGRRRTAGPLLATTLAPAALVIAPAALAAEETTRVEPNRSLVGWGKPARLQGSGAPAGTPVLIEFRRPGGSWREMRSVTAKASGSFRARIKPRFNGNWRAVPQGAPASDPVRIEVRSRLRLSTRRHQLVGKPVRSRGKVRPAGQRRVVTLRIGGERIRTRTKRDGSFRARWRPSKTGRYRARAKVAPDRAARGRSRRGPRVTIYRPAQASWYGPGFYGSRTACGRTLGTRTLGVAHKRLPCGTRVTLRYRGRSVRVPVIDRGPYAGNREWDLTAETKRRIGFGSTGTVLSSK